MTSGRDEPRSPLTPSQVHTPAESMTNSPDALAWDEVAEALDLQSFDDFPGKPETDFFPPLDLSNIPAPDLKPARVATRPPAHQSSAPVATVKRQTRKAAARKGTRKGKQEKKEIDQPPHVVDGEIDRFPRLKNVTPLVRHRHVDAGVYAKDEVRRVGDMQARGPDPFSPRANAGGMAPPNSFYDSAVPQQFNFRNYAPFPGNHYGFLLPPANQQQDLRNKPWTPDLERGNPNNWIPNPHMHDQLAFPQQFNGMAPWYGSMSFPTQQMHPQTMFPQNMNQDQYMSPSRHSNHPAPRCRAPPRSHPVAALKHAARENRQVPSMVYEALLRKKHLLASLHNADNAPRGIRAQPKGGRPAQAPPVGPHGTSDGVQENVAQPPHNHRPVPDLAVLKRTLENINKSNATKKSRAQNRAKNCRQAKKGSNQQGAKLPHNTSADGQGQRESIPVPTGAPADHPPRRLALNGGIQKQPYPKTGGAQGRNKKLNRNWRNSQTQMEGRTQVDDHWAQLRGRNMQSGRGSGREAQGGSYPVDLAGQGGHCANVTVGNGGGYCGENAQNGGGQYESRRSVFDRLGYR